MDAALPADEIEQIEAEIGKLLPNGTSFHDLRTRQIRLAPFHRFSSAGAGNKHSERGACPVRPD